MVDITHKSNTLRQAIAQATIIVSKQETVEAIQQKKVPKGDVFEFAKAAGLLAIKKTSDLIPDCHPLPIEFASFSYEIEDNCLHIKCEVRTIYKTGVEVEAMCGASIAAITIYDMLKPIDKGVFISTIRLLSKKGGKSDFKSLSSDGLKAVVIVCSDTLAQNPNDDVSGKRVVDALTGHQIVVIRHEIIADDFTTIQAIAKDVSANEAADLLIYVGGTGLSQRDVTPEAIRPLLTKEVAGIMEAARTYGQQRTPYAMLSRGVAGFIDKTFVLTLPGSPKGAIETLDALFPQILHVFSVAKGERHG